MYDRSMLGDEASLAWHKSSKSGGNGGACVEVAHTDVATGVRDTKQAGEPGRPVLVFGNAAWATFVADVRDGRHDLV
jgi:hypothetical protein